MLNILKLYYFATLSVVTEYCKQLHNYYKSLLQFILLQNDFQVLDYIYLVLATYWTIVNYVRRSYT